MTSGLQPGDMIVLAARPSMGKTSLAINIAEHVALEEGLPVAVFSMEMGASQLAVRIVGSIGRIDQGHLRTGKLSDEEWPRLTEAIEKLRTVSLHIDETPGLSTSELRANARRLARQYGRLGLIVVDYLQLMSTSSSGDENRATAVGEISRGLKMLAKELKCPVIALSQLSRGVESRTDKRPMMSDLRESGAIEQDADIIMFIYRDDYYDKNSKEPGVAEVIISKHRNGPTGTVKLAFLKPITKFENLDLPLHLLDIQGPQHVGQRLAGLVAKSIGQQLDGLHAVQPEAAEIVAKLAPCRQRPDLAPVEAAQRPYRALAGFARHVAVDQVQFVARLHRFAQRLQPLAQRQKLAQAHGLLRQSLGLVRLLRHQHQLLRGGIGIGLGRLQGLEVARAVACQLHRLEHQPLHRIEHRANGLAHGPGDLKAGIGHHQEQRQRAERGHGDADAEPQFHFAGLQQSAGAVEKCGHDALHRRWPATIETTGARCGTGTAISAAAVGVGARLSAAKSISVMSVSWPTAEISGIMLSAAA
eukprot:gene36342-48947_t